MADIVLMVVGFTPGVFPFIGNPRNAYDVPNAEVAGPALYKFHRKYTLEQTNSRMSRCFVFYLTYPLQVLTKQHNK
jgi:hypothetical protein